MRSLLSLLFFAFLILSCNQNTVDKNDQTAEITDTLKYKTVVLAIEGMTCENCENTIQESVCKLNGVQQIQASHVQAQATIVFDTTISNIVVISENINDLGYIVKGEVLN